MFASCLRPLSGCWVSLIVTCAASVAAAPAAVPPPHADSFAVLPAVPEAAPAEGMVARYLSGLAAEREAERDAEVAAIRTVPQLQAWQRKTRARLINLLGGLPPRTPLNARITGVLERGDYRVEKIVYESLPGYFVTANFYLPTWKKKSPAFIGPVGHWLEGKSYEDYQRLGIEMAKHGYALFTYDPPGQGERMEYFDPVTGHDRGGPKSTTSHTIVGYQCFLAGNSLARYFAWDGIRAIDYLQSRSEIDGDHVGSIGGSGGGTLTRLISALDERVKISIPIVSVATKGGPGGSNDGEQNIAGSVAAGIWLQDQMWLLPPRPVINLLATVDNYFADAKRSISDVQRAYDLFGLKDAAVAIEAEGKHGLLPELRKAAYEFIDRHWRGVTELRPVVIGDGDLEKQEDLWATETGQIALSLGGRTSFDVNLEQIDARRSKEASGPATRDAIREFLNLPEVIRPRSVRVVATEDRGAFRMERVALESEAGVWIPALVLAPNRGGRLPAVLIVDDLGKDRHAAAGGLMEQLAQAGRVVVAIDARGLGETAPAPDPRTAKKTTHELLYNHFFLRSSASVQARAAINLARPLPALRTHDSLVALDYLAGRGDVATGDLRVIGLGEGGVLAMFAAAVDPRVSQVITYRMLADFHSLAANRMYAQPASLFIPRILEHFDLPQVCASIAPRQVLLVNTVDEMGRRLPEADVQSRYRAAPNSRPVVELDARHLARLVTTAARP